MDILNSSLDSLKSGDVSQLITEEDLLDSLYYTCDKDHNGRVFVSIFIEYLKLTVLNENQNDIDMLTMILDPGGQNPAIDLNTFRDGITAWIEDIRLRNGLNADDNPLSKIPLIPYFESCSGDLSSSFANLADLDEFNASYGNLETSNSLNKTQHDDAEHSTMVRDLQHQNKKLLEENFKLQQQLRSQDETLSNFAVEKEAMLKKFKSLQTLVDLRQQTLQENEFLKSSIHQLQDEDRISQRRLQQYERENIELDTRYKKLAIRFQQASFELEDSISKEQNIQDSFLLQKKRYKECEDLRRVQETQFLNKTQECAELEDQMESMSRCNESLKQDQLDLKAELSQTQEDLTRLRLKSDKYGLTAPGSSSDEETVVSVKKSKKNANMSPRVKSIKMELKSMLDKTRDLPSPLCEKDLEDDVFLRKTCSGSYKQQDSDASSQLMSDMKTKVDLLVQQLTQYITVSGKQEKSYLRKPEHIKPLIKRELDDFVRKIMTVSRQKEAANKRAESMRKEVMKLREENEKLKFGRQETSKRESIHENKIKLLTEQLEKEVQKRKQLESELKTCYNELTEKERRASLAQSSCDSLQLSYRDLQIQVKELRRANLEMADKCHKAELKLLDHKDESTRASEMAVKEHQKCQDLEDSLASTKLARQIDLRDIWRLVQKEVEKELDEQKESPISKSTELLKEQIEHDINHLRVQLQKKQVTFDTLRNNPQFIFPPQSKCSQNLQVNLSRDSPPSSPLVDALTIEFLDGSVPSRKNSRKSSGLENLLAAQTHDDSSTRDVAMSCPVLDHHNQQVTSATQTDHLESFSDINTSYSSSTSGAVDLDYGSDSLDCKLKRKDYIRSSQRFTESADSQVSQSIDSTTDTDNSLSRQRNIYLATSLDYPSKGENSDLTPPQGFRRKSFIHAIDSNQNYIEGVNGNRRLSFQAAIENGSVVPMDIDVASNGPSVASSPDNPVAPDLFMREIPLYQNTYKSEPKSVYFQLINRPTSMPYINPESVFDLNYNGCNDADIYAYDYSHSNGYPIAGLDNFNIQDQGLHKAQQSESANDQNDSPKPARKLSTLIEEDDGNTLPTSQPSKFQCVSYKNKLNSSREARHSSNSHNTSVSDIYDAFSVRDPGLDSPPTPGKQDKPLMASSPQDTEVNAETDPQPVEEDAKDKTPPATEIAPKPSPVPRKRWSLEENRQNSTDVTVPLPPTSSHDEGIDDTSHKDADESSEKILQAEAVSTSALKSTKSRISAAVLEKYREERAAKKLEQMKHMKMPGLTEFSESRAGASEEINGFLHPPDPSDEPVLPSIPDDYLQRLSLLPGNITNEAEQLTEQEIENKFASLSLAFKTDKLTIDKRMDIQQRSRDIAEKNVQSEMEGLRMAVETLSTMCTDLQTHDVLTRIKHHIEILEQSSGRVSNRAEVFGAVQQEGRMSQAIEIMVQHVDNLKRLYEKEHSELEEARSQLHDNRSYSTTLSESGDVILSRRSQSMAGAAGLKQPPYHRYNASPAPTTATKLAVEGGRRRASMVTLPRMMGGTGGLINMSPKASLDTSLFMESKPIGPRQGQSMSEDEDPKSRFQAAVVNTSIRNAVTGAFRRSSDVDVRPSDRASSQEPFSATESSAMHQNNINHASNRVTEPAVHHRRHPVEHSEPLLNELTDLREKHRKFSETLKDLQRRASSKWLLERLWKYWPRFSITRRELRHFAVGVILLMALGTAIMAVTGTSFSIDKRHHHSEMPPL